jgi:23S rRNA-/tRNA-specific pseudouridylate synthase
LYGGAEAVRLMLRARSLAFTHPVTGEPMVFECQSDF